MGHKIIGPQKGPQETFLSTSADIAIYGGSAGGGKTYALLLEAGIRHKDNPNFGAVIFRHEYTQIHTQGGLWDSSKALYSQVRGAIPLKSPKYHWIFPSGAQVHFDYINSDANLDSWQGSQITMIGYDELTHFTAHQFFYMLSRNRSISGIRPYVRATCNPDADSWVAYFISWWINPDTGYPISERSGIVRYMVRINEEIIWSDTREEAVQTALAAGFDVEQALLMAKSVTFIASTLDDNKILLENDPGYKANLLALPEVERERLLKGNWKIKAAAGLMFRRTDITMLPGVPPDVIKWARGWDLAATSEDEKGNPAYTASVLMGLRKNGRFVIAEVTNDRLAGGDVRNLIKNKCVTDRAQYGTVYTRLPQDPGQAGKVQAQSFAKLLAGFNIKIEPESGDKVTRAEPFAAQWQFHNVDVVAGSWNEVYFGQAESFPQSTFKDMVDAGSSAFVQLTEDDFDINNLI